MGMLKNANVVGQNVVKFRHRAGWTQDVLAEVFCVAVDGLFPQCGDKHYSVRETRLQLT